MVKVEVKQSKKSYPYIGVSDHSIVLFNSPGEGTMLWHDDTSNLSPPGYYTNIWNESKFKLYKGTVILENG